MPGKEYIAIFLVMVFSGKLITVDTDILSFILEANQVVLLNPFCEKKSNNIKETGDHFKTSSPVQILKLARTCSNNYQLISGKEIPIVFPSDYKQFVYKKLRINNNYSRKLYPPPKYSIAI
ncbi:hypothetical protein DHD80_10700 [Gramella sp. AN32]|nr:hypothetical protein [Gramella sp. AN32]